MKQINVTQTFLPPLEEYEAYLDKIWQSNQLTNQGPLLQKFESELKRKMNITKYDFQLVSNGTTALQIALKALDITDGEVITTPFSYVATASSILWERCTPVFVDIDPGTLCIDPSKIEAAITDKTRAIMPVHVFGNPCDIEKIQELAEKHKLKVVYDAAHAFGVEYKGRSIFEYGDISICSFHSTKLFHTIEGGGVFIRDKTVSDRLDLVKRFGHRGDNHIMLGINAKASEFQAAMGLCNLKYINKIIDGRKKASDTYNELLGGILRRPVISPETSYNYSYYPVIFNSEKELLNTIARLNANSIFPRRYFYPSLNTLPYLKNIKQCPVSEDISRRILCLPLYADMELSVVNRICEVIT